jgi:hypothetical protein
LRYFGRNRLLFATKEGKDVPQGLKPKMIS